MKRFPCPRRVMPFLAVALLLSALASAPVAGQRRLPSDLLKDGSTVKAAFQDVVKRASRSAVNVRTDGRIRARAALVSPNGHIITKASEISGSPIVCELPDGRELEARIVHQDDDTDLMLLKIQATGLPFLLWEKPALAQGQWVIAPGQGINPLAVGVVSTPPHRVIRRTGFLGVQIENSDAGPVIGEVFPRTAASRAGIAQNDIILEVDGSKVSNRERLVARIRQYSPGTRVEFKVQRGEDTLTLRATLGERNSPPTGNRNTRRLSRRRSGFPSVFEHDAVLMPNECGGALLNIDGKAIGIDIARAGRTGCYALPGNVVQKFLDGHLDKVLPPVFHTD